MLDGLGSWNLAARGSTIRLHACCGAAHWSMDAMQHILRGRSVTPDEIEAIDVEIPEFLTDMVPIHAPRTGLEAKYSLEYDLAAIALDGRAGINQYTDAALARPDAQALMARVRTIPVNGPLQSRVVLTLTNGEQLEATATRAHGNPADPLTEAEIVGKFHECAAQSATEAQRARVIDLCGRIEALGNVRELADAIAAVS
jgi:2-methylcitrate dehydratase PrpD